jgi:hypothetical protein
MYPILGIVAEPLIKLQYEQGATITLRVIVRERKQREVNGRYQRIRKRDVSIHITVTVMCCCTCMCCLTGEREPEKNKPEGTLPVKAGNRGGRPRFPEDEWAREQIWESGRSKVEVYREWLKRAGSDRIQTKADPWDTFRHLIKKPRRKLENSE